MSAGSKPTRICTPLPQVGPPLECLRVGFFLFGAHRRGRGGVGSRICTCLFWSFGASRAGLCEFGQVWSPLRRMCIYQNSLLLGFPGFSAQRTVFKLRYALHCSTRARFKPVSDIAALEARQRWMLRILGSRGKDPKIRRPQLVPLLFEIVTPSIRQQLDGCPRSQ